MDHPEIWKEAIEKAKANPQLEALVPLMEFQRDVTYPQGETAVRNWLQWIENQSAH